MPEEPQFLPLTHRHLKVTMPDLTTHDCWCDFTTNEALLVQEIDGKPIAWEIFTINEAGPLKLEDRKRFEHAVWGITEEPQRYKQEILHSPGGIPGIPGSHGPGTYMIDWQERKVYALQEWEDMQVKPVLTGIITGVDTDGNAASEVISVAPNTTTYSKKRYAKLGTEQVTQDESVL